MGGRQNRCHTNIEITVNGPLLAFSRVIRINSLVRFGTAGAGFSGDVSHPTNVSNKCVWHLYRKLKPKTVFEYSLVGRFVGRDKLPKSCFELSLLLRAPRVTKRCWALVCFLAFGVWVHCEYSH